MNNSVRIFALSLIALIGASGCGGSPRPPRGGAAANIATVSEISVDTTLLSKEVAPFELAPGDWPCWRGPSQQGHAENSSLPVNYKESEHLLWQSKVPGRGHASPIVTHGLVFLATADVVKQTQSVLAYDLQSGLEKWNKIAFEGNFEEQRNIHQKSTHASSTMATDGKLVYAAFLNDHAIQVIAYDLEGQLKWKQQAAPYVSRFGFGTSLTLFDNLVILPVEHEGGGSIVALDRQSGSIIWRKPRKSFNSYQTPRILELDGQRLGFISGNQQLTAFDPINGEVKYALDNITETHIGSIINEENLIAVSGGYPGQETIGFEVTSSGAKELWRNKEKIYIPSMLVYEGHVYAISDDGVGHCWELKTGTKKWKTRVSGTFTASPVDSQGYMYFPSEQGEVKVIKLSPTAYELVDSWKLGNIINASPAVANNSLLLRVMRREAEREQEYLIRIGIK